MPSSIDGGYRSPLYHRNAHAGQELRHNPADAPPGFRGAAQNGQEAYLPLNQTSVRLFLARPASVPLLPTKSRNFHFWRCPGLGFRHGWSGEGFHILRRSCAAVGFGCSDTPQTKIVCHALVTPDGRKAPAEAYSGAAMALKAA